MARRTRRRRRREGREEMALVEKIVQPLRRVPVYALAEEEVIETIHQKSLQVLAEVGIAFYDAETQAILKAHGVTVREDIAYFDPAVVEEYVAKAPASFTQLARNPERNVHIGDGAVCFAPVYGPPYVLDWERGRRASTLEDFHNFVKLAYMSPYLHHSGGTLVEPNDVPVPERHLDMVFAHIKYSDKPFMGSVTSGANALDSVRMAEIVFGAERMREQPALLSLINVSSPRRFDERMLGALRVYAEARQALLITPFILSGAMAPVSIAGTLVQMNAEALAGIVLAQMISPGTPVIYGSFQTNVDLRSGAPVFGSPESQIALLVGSQLARRYNVPFRSGGMLTSAKIPDAQAGYESVMSMLPAIFARVHFILHAAGWLENGLTAGYEKFVLDCNVLGMFDTFLKGLDTSEDAWAEEAIRTVPPGGHHLDTPHTLRHYRTAFYQAPLFDYSSAEQWESQGKKDAYRRAHEWVRRWLREYTPPPLDPGIEEALQDYIARRREEIRKQPPEV